MNILLFIKQAISSIKSNKLRSFLSALGIIIGILSFVLMLSFGEGTKAQIKQSLGAAANVVNVMKGRDGMGGMDGSGGKSQRTKKEGKNIFTEEIVAEIKQKVPNVSKAILGYNLFYAPTIYKGKKVDQISSFNPVTQDFFKDKGAKLILGSYFGQDDFKERRKVVILGNKLVKPIFGNENPIGQKLSIGGEIFFVGGVLEEKGFEYDNYAFMPNTVAKKFFGKDDGNKLEVYSKTEDQVDQLKKDLNYFLFKKTALENYEDVDYSLSTNKDLLKQVEQFTKQFTYFLVGIGAISLIVGGIGIMNITLVSVTERTREIGIRKAIGASNFSVLFQFLIESVILTFLGSTIAIALSYLIVRFVDTYKPLGPELAIVINMDVLIIAIAVSITIGVVFGIMPAYKAARLKPIDALHFE
ncbi:FtsX-like permease family protein [Candidatus Gracilibacteria bacterium]|nr:MAG: FtsX-like permease family protein [Candidatus Gracilibacteria bacterium]